ncbi:MAG: hypothetical protein RL095_3139 [Verrucomicrobiota bacterium]
MLAVMSASVFFAFLDAWIVSRLSPAHRSAMSLVLPVLTFSTALLYGGLGTATAAAVARHAPSGRLAEASRALRDGALLAFFAGCLAAATVLAAGPRLLAGAGVEASAEASALALDYCRCYFPLLGLSALGAVGSAALRGSGEAKRPAIYALAVMTLDGLAKPFVVWSEFQLGPLELSGLCLGAGIRGAALSTVAAYSLLALLIWRDLLRPAGLARHAPSPASQRRFILAAALTAAAVPLATNVGIGLVQHLLAPRGLSLMDAYSYARRFELCLIQLAVPLGAATMIIIAAAHGAGRPKRAREAFDFALKLTLLGSILIAALMALAPPLWHRLFSPDDPVFLAEGRLYFRAAFLHVVAVPALIIVNFAFQGLGRPHLPLPWTLGSILGAQILAALLLLPQGQPSWVYYLVTSCVSPLALVAAAGLFRRQIASDHGSATGSG